MTRWIPALLGLALAAGGVFAGWKVRDRSHRTLRESVGADQLAALRQRLDEWDRLPAAERQRIGELHKAIEAEPAKAAARLHSAGWYAQVRDLMPQADRQRLDAASSVADRMDLVEKAMSGSVRELEEYRADVGRRMQEEFRRAFAGPTEFAAVLDDLAAGRQTELKGPLKRLSPEILERHRTAFLKLAPEDKGLYAVAMLAAESGAIGDDFRKGQTAKLVHDLLGRAVGDQLPKTEWWKALFRDRKFSDLSGEELALLGRFTLWAVKSETPLPEDEIARKLPETDPIRVHLKEASREGRPFPMGPPRPNRELIAVAWYFDADRLLELGRSSKSEELDYRKLLLDAKVGLPGSRLMDRPGMPERPPLLPGDRIRKAAKKIAGKTKDD